MQPIVMQDWITIRGLASASVIMSQADWILTAPFQDITFYLDVRESDAAGMTCAYQTSPSRDEVLFVNMGTPVPMTSAVVTVTSYNLTGAPAAPVSHWTRWKLTGPASAWDVTFRIMAAGNSIG